MINHNNKLVVTSFINENYKFLFYLLILIIYFAWMDIGLFMSLQKWQAPSLNPMQEVNSTLKSTTNANSFKYNYVETFSIYKPLSVKLIMIDHVSHYVHDILARYLEDTLHFTDIFPWITPNFVSFMGLFFALLASRMIISNKLFYCQIGALLFELRNLADSLDGVVYRSRQRKLNTEKIVGVYQSNYGSLGYNVDVICDGLGGTFFCVAILIKFLKNLPLKNSNKMLINMCKNETNDSNYRYYKLETNDLNDEECMEMNVVKDNDNLEELNLKLKSKRLPSNDSISEAFAIHKELAGGYNKSDNLMIKRHFSSRQVKMICWFFGLRLLFTGLIWDHYVHKYHDLLMVFSNNANKRNLQAQAFKSIGMWLIMWFWRLGNACAILEHLVMATFFNKLWEYLLYTTYIGWAFLICLTLITQIHYTELYESLNSFSAFT